MSVYGFILPEKCVAKEDIEEDGSGHLYTRGEQYLKCRHLEPVKPVKKGHALLQGT